MEECMGNLGSTEKIKKMFRQFYNLSRVPVEEAYNWNDLLANVHYGITGSVLIDLLLTCPHCQVVCDESYVIRKVPDDLLEGTEVFFCAECLTRALVWICPRRTSTVIHLRVVPTALTTMRSTRNPS